MRRILLLTPLALALAGCASSPCSGGLLVQYLKPPMVSTSMPVSQSVGPIGGLPVGSAVVEGPGAPVRMAMPLAPPSCSPSNASQAFAAERIPAPQQLPDCTLQMICDTLRSMNVILKDLQARQQRERMPPEE